MDPDLATELGIMPGSTIQVDTASASMPAGSFGMASGTGAGQHGITPITGSGSAMFNGVNAVWDWLNTPFKQPMSPAGIGLMVGSVIVAILFWNLLLYHLRIAAESL